MLIRKYKKDDELGIIQLDKLTETHPWNRRNLKNWKHLQPEQERSSYGLLKGRWSPSLE